MDTLTPRREAQYGWQDAQVTLRQLKLVYSVCQQCNPILWDFLFPLYDFPRYYASKQIYIIFFPFSQAVVNQVFQNLGITVSKMITSFCQYLLILASLIFINVMSRC